ncbi:MAG: uracil-DNA glycosylase [Gammaproteobacteria bacterium]|nr:uracil-DNA glycosylase [Gammaproteobacteria bacterium]
MLLSDKQRSYLHAMGIDVYQRQDAPCVQLLTTAAGAITPDPEDKSLSQVQEPIPLTPPSNSPTQLTLLDWAALQTAVRGCTACGLHQTRTQTVFGVGDPKAQLMFIGEAPGAEEDRQGEPFVGRAGQLLNQMLLAIELQRSQVYIANILKCRPPNNRDPKPEEAAQCWPYLQRQIEIVQPRLLVALGRIAAQRLLKTDTPLVRLRQKQHHPEGLGVPLIVTYHPAYLLRSPQDKRKAWEDLLYIRNTLRETTK